MRDIYINSKLNSLTKFTSSSRSTEFEDILPCNMSQMITKTVPLSRRIVISNAMTRGIPLIKRKKFWRFFFFFFNSKMAAEADVGNCKGGKLVSIFQMMVPKHVHMG